MAPLASLQLRDFRYAAGVPPSQELCAQEQVHQAGGALLIEVARAQGEDVGVVMLAGEADFIVRLGGRRAHAGHFVSGHGHADSGRAHQDAAVGAALGYLARNRLGKIRIVAGFARAGAEIHHLMAFLDKAPPELLFEGKSGVVRAQCNFHKGRRVDFTMRNSGGLRAQPPRAQPLRTCTGRRGGRGATNTAISGVHAKPERTIIKDMDWPRIGADLNGSGYAVIPRLLEAGECTALRDLYPQDGLFRSRIVMERHGFGRGEYKYFEYPLPERVGELRAALFPGLARIANGWNESLGAGLRYPETHQAYLRMCHEAGQIRPTPLLLSYGAGDYNCLHQDLYGDLVFPLQVAVLLSGAGDFTGGEFVLTEQRPRRQSRVEVVPLSQGDAVVFPVNHRPVRGARGVYRVTMRHGVSRVRSGSRRTLGIIFHDAL